jgi:hypothetical protein
MDRAITVALVSIVVLSGAELVHATVHHDTFSQSLALVLLLVALFPLASETRDRLTRRRLH